MSASSSQVLATEPQELTETEAMNPKPQKSRHLSHALKQLADSPEMPFSEVARDQFGSEMPREAARDHKHYDSFGTELINFIWGWGEHSRGENITCGPWEAETFEAVRIKTQGDPRPGEVEEEERAAWHRSSGIKYSSSGHEIGRQKRRRLSSEGKRENPSQTKDYTLYEQILDWPPGPLSKIGESELIKLLKSGNKEAQDEFYRRIYAWGFRWLMRTGKARSEHDAEDILSDSIREAIESIQDFRGDSRLYTWVYPIIEHNATDFYKREQPRYDSHSHDVTTYEEDAGADPFTSEGGGDPEELGRQGEDYRMRQGWSGDDGAQGDQTEQKYVFPSAPSRMPNPEAIYLLGGHYEGTIDGYHWEIKIVGERRRQLKRYISKLRKEHLEIIQCRFFKEMLFGEIAAKIGITADAAEHRERRALEKLRKLVEEDGYFEERRIPEDWTGRVLTQERIDRLRFQRYADEQTRILQNIRSDLRAI